MDSLKCIEDTSEAEEKKMQEHGCGTNYVVFTFTHTGTGSCEQTLPQTS